MKRIAVTGGSGKLGRAVVGHLADSGYEVFNLDRVSAPPNGATNGPVSIRVDLTDYGQTFEALHAIEDRYDSIDAVVHLAAIPAPGLIPNAATFDNNITSTHHVFSAAKAAGIKRIVWASSETVLGLPMSPANPPPYLPVDEEYHPRPESSYSLAKTLEEEMALQFCRRDPSTHHDRAAVLQRDGARGLRGLPVVRRRHHPARPGMPGVTSTPATAPRPSGSDWRLTSPAARSSSSPTPTR